MYKEEKEPTLFDENHSKKEETAGSGNKSLFEERIVGKGIGGDDHNNIETPKYERDRQAASKIVVFFNNNTFKEYYPG